MRFGPIAAALVLAAAASPALAQNVPDQPAGAAPAPSANPVERFQAYVQLDGYKSMLSQMATVGETVSAPECKEHKAVSHTIMAVFVPPAFADQSQIIPVNTKRDKEIKPLKIDEKGKVVEGAWKETWTLKACGKTVNATVDLTADGKGGLAHKVKL